nr:nickel-dependent hydrogenase large subunit [Enterovibrio nigricans]
MQMKETVDALSEDIHGDFFLPPNPQDEVDGKGFGMIQAARGGLGHWISIKEGVIDRYQIITPTAWNASPRDSEGTHGHWEQSVIGLPIDDMENPLMLGHVIRSHDPCLVCTVHMLPTGKKLRFSV